MQKEKLFVAKVDSCEICSKRVMSNAVLRTVCKKWIHARCAQTKKYPAVLHNSLSAEDVKILETARRTSGGVV